MEVRRGRDKGRTVGSRGSGGRIGRRKEGEGGPCVSKGFRVFRITSCSAPELVCRDSASNSFILTYRRTWSKYMRHYTELRTKPPAVTRRGGLVKSSVNRKQIVREANSVHSVRIVCASRLCTSRLPSSSSFLWKQRRPFRSVGDIEMTLHFRCRMLSK